VGHDEARGERRRYDEGHADGGQLPRIVPALTSHVRSFARFEMGRMAKVIYPAAIRMPAPAPPTGALWSELGSVAYVRGRKVFTRSLNFTPSVKKSLRSHLNQRDVLRGQPAGDLGPVPGLPTLPGPDRLHRNHDVGK